MKLPLPNFDGTNVWHIFPILHTRRNEIRDHLAKAGIETLIHYPIPPYKQEAYQDYEFNWLHFPVTNEIHDNTLSLPLWPGMSVKEIKYISNSINSFNLEN
jgi:dTDP-4-amino-4,6-dideoxygalactose transaminase